MAANLDKSENSLTSVSTLTYLRGIDASGNSVKISTSDLASVLGVNKIIRTGGDANNFVNTGLYYLTSNLSNMPENSGWWIFKVVKASDSCVSQVAFRDDKNTAYVRICNNNIWGDWGKIAIGYPEFYKNYGTLETLASAVNGLFTHHPTDITDADNLKQTGVYQSANFTNVPIGGGNLLIVIRGVEDYVCQFVVGVGSPFIYFRGCVDRAGWNWYEWNSINVTSVV